ncbi:MAG: sigma 54-interacting transcriptional regulator [Bdellovibrionota bacterium]
MAAPNSKKVDLELIEALASHPQEPAALFLVPKGQPPDPAALAPIGVFTVLARPSAPGILAHHLDVLLSVRRSNDERVLVSRVRESRPRISLLLPSQAMKETYKRITRLALSPDTAVFITGEPSTGKDHAAQMLHDLSPRASQPFITLSCRETNPSTLHSEIFGHEKGAFAGALERKKGLLELVGQGTLFLKDVENLPLDLQSALLSVLQRKAFHRRGGKMEISMTARLAVSTNRDLSQAVLERKFNEELFRKLQEAEIHVAPLRTRIEDVVFLATHFCNQLASTLGVQTSLSDDAMAELASYGWPGNVRELRNAIEWAVLRHGGGVLHRDALGFASQRAPAAQGTAESPASYRSKSAAADFPLAPGGRVLTLVEAEKLHIQNVLRLHGGNRTRAAETLGIARSTLVRKIEELGLGEEF